MIQFQYIIITTDQLALLDAMPTWICKVAAEGALPHLPGKLYRIPMSELDQGMLAHIHQVIGDFQQEEVVIFK